MKRYQWFLRIAGGISLLVLLAFGITTALLTDKEQRQIGVDIPGEMVDLELTMNGLVGDSIQAVSGQTFDLKPIITNFGTANVYTFIEIDVPMLVNAPIFTYTADESDWNLVGSETADGYQKAVYSYGSLTVLDAGADTSEHPLIETATFANIRSETDEQLSVIIKAYAATDLGFDGEPGSLDPVAVCTTTLDTAGE